MEQKTSIPPELSRELGKLFYAIAKADGALAIEEYVKLSDSLQKDWNSYEQESLELIKEEFNSVQSDNCEPDTCFRSFVNYLRENPEVFNENLKTLIFKTGNTIAYALAKINKSELNVMARLSIAFKKLKL